MPRIAIVKGRCFAGNAVIAGASDLIVATRDASLGMGGPAMITAAAALGDVPPDEVGPMTTQEPNGNVDVVVDDEADAVAVTKTLLGYFQGPADSWSAPDQTVLRTAVRDRARRAYDVAPVIETIADEDSVTFLRPRFAREMVTALARVEGRPVGVIANDTRFTAGAITAAASDKAARFLQLCDAFGFPVVSLIDCPGYMVGPAAGGEIAGAPGIANVGGGRRTLRPDGRGDPAARLRAWRPGDGRRPARTGADGGLAGGRTWGRWDWRAQIRLGMRKERRHRRRAGARGTRPAGDRGGAGEREGAERGDAVRDRRRDRPGGDPRGDRGDVRGGRYGHEKTGSRTEPVRQVRRYLVTLGDACASRRVVARSDCSGWGPGHTRHRRSI